MLSAAAMKTILHCSFVIATTIGLTWASGEAAGDQASRQAAKPRKETRSPALPPKLIEMIAQKYEREDIRANLARLFTRSNQAFEVAWSAYHKRAAEVRAGLEEADALVRAGKLTEAQAAIVALVTRTPLDERGRVASKRQLVEPRDAELVAIKGLAPVVNKTRDYHILTALAPELYVRRTPGTDKDAERWMWFAYRNGETFSNLGAGQSAEVATFVTDKAALARKAAQEGPAFGSGLIDSLALKRATFGQKKSATSGDWIAARLDPPRFDGKKGTLKVDRVVDIPYACKDGKVVGIDMVSGRFIHAPECKHKSERVKYTVAIALETEPAASLPRNALLIGKVEAGGPGWKIARAHFPDLRWRESVTGWQPSEYEYTSPEGKQVVFPEGTAW